jgi:hypothetical protein
MTNALTTASEARRNEWARVNDLLPWAAAPEWARFATLYSGFWMWTEKPPAPDYADFEVTGRAQPFFPDKRIFTGEHMFRRPGPPAAPSGVTRLMMANVPIAIAAAVGMKADPEREALLIYARILDEARARWFGVKFDEVVKNAIKGTD